MELLPDNPYTLSGPDDRDVVTITFPLTSAASAQWVAVFNHWRTTIQARTGSAAITVVDLRANLVAHGIAGAVAQLISLTDAEVSADALKNAILLAHLARGMVVIHDSLPYMQPSSTPPMSQPYSDPLTHDYRPMWFQPYLDLVASRNFTL